MPDGDESRPARLPPKAPDALKRFVKCEVDEVTLDLSDTSWLEGVPIISGATVTVRPGSTSTRGTINLDTGFSSFDLHVSISNGQLSADVEGTGEDMIQGPVDEWVDALNRTLRENGKQFRDFQVDGNRLTMRKEAISTDTGAAAVGTGAAGPDDTGTSGEPEAEPEPPKRKPSGCLAWVLAGLVAIAAAVGITLAVTGDDAGDDGAITSGTGEPAAASTTTSSSTTTAAPTTTQQVGQVPPPATDEVPETRVCGAAPDTGEPWQSDPDAIARWEQATSWPCAPPPDGYGGCDPDILPCSTAEYAALTQVGMEGVDHTRTTTDPMTGLDGNSVLEHAIAMFAQTGDVEWLVKIISDCGGNMLSGQALLNVNGPTIVEQPLLSFGQCTVVDTVIEIAAGEPDPALAEAVARSISASVVGRPIVIGADEPDPAFPSVLDDLTVANRADEVMVDWHADAVTLGNTFAVEPLAQDCLWFFDVSNPEVLVKVLDACAGDVNDHFWVFYGATTDVEIGLDEPDTLVGTSGAHVNPLGALDPAPIDWQAFDTTAFYFDNTIYRCGYGHIAYTACAAEPLPMEAGALVTVTAAALAPIPIEGDGTERIHEVEFTPAGGPAYRIAQGDDGWTVGSSAGDTRARAILRDNALMLVVPEDELPPGALAYVWRTTVDGRTHEQPVVPVASLITSPTFPAEEPPPATDPPVTDPPPTDPPTTDEPAPAESVEDFYAGLSRSISSGELDFALDRLDPTVYEAYPTECPAALESFVDPDFNAEPIAVGETGPWTWALPDGRSFEIADATTVTIVLTGRGQSGTEAEAHLTDIDGRWHWFTFCA